MVKGPITEFWKTTGGKRGKKVEGRVKEDEWKKIRNVREG